MTILQAGGIAPAFALQDGSSRSPDALAQAIQRAIGR